MSPNTTIVMTFCVNSVSYFCLHIIIVDYFSTCTQSNFTGAKSLNSCRFGVDHEIFRLMLYKKVWVYMYMRPRKCPGTTFVSICPTL